MGTETVTDKYVLKKLFVRKSSNRQVYHAICTASKSHDLSLIFLKFICTIDMDQDIKQKSSHIFVVTRDTMKYIGT